MRSDLDEHDVNRWGPDSNARAPTSRGRNVICVLAMCGLIGVCALGGCRHRTTDEEASTEDEGVPESRGRAMPAVGDGTRESLRENIEADYANALGGLDQAVNLAQKAIEERPAGSIFNRWQREDLDKTIQIIQADRWPPARVAPEPGIDVASEEALFVPKLQTIFIRSGVSDPEDAKKHELTHATIGTAKTRLLSTAPDLWRNFGGSKGLISQSYWDYAGTARELDPRIAEVKRRYVRDTGQQVETKDDAEKAIQHWRQTHSGDPADPDFKTDAGALIDVREPELRDQILQRMLEIVQRSREFIAYPRRTTA
jgi:hypothetical protein